MTSAMAADYYDLGSHSWPIATRCGEAQMWFDRGMAWVQGFNHEAALDCFQRALASDNDCAMAHWGIAYAIGPNYNRLWQDFGERERGRCLARAQAESRLAAAKAASGPALERALCEALLARYPTCGGDDYDGWNDAYADAMRRVHADHGGHPEVAALFAEALLNRTPWQLWDKDGRAAEGAGTLEAVAVLEGALEGGEQARRHPGLLHMYIHAMEMSDRPERAQKAADTLFDLMPDCGHLRHMPSHIDVLCGHYHHVLTRNHAAVVADRKYLQREGAMNLYSGYRAHDYHFKVYGAMFLGQFAPALEAAEEMVATLPPELLASGDPPMADWLESYISVKQHVLIRFGRWRDILAQALPDDAELYCTTVAMMRYARSVACSALGDIAAAEAERDAFLAARDLVPESRKLFHNTCLDILAVAERMLLGELDYRKGRIEEAFRHLRRSVELDDNMLYDEPWAWMQPTRHALGALLLEQGRFDEAEAVYRADLGLDDTLRRCCQHPDNVWSLHGLHECLARRGAEGEAAFVAQRLAIAAARADVPIRASCFCRLQAQ